MKSWKVVAALAGLACVLAIANLDIFRKQAIVDAGRPLLLPIAAVDPKRKVHDDHVHLYYAQTIYPPRAIVEASPFAGVVVLTVDERSVARFGRVDDGAPLGPNEVRLRYNGNRSGDRLRYGPGTYYFEEGGIERYWGARYAVLHVDDHGLAVFVGLADEHGILIARRPSASAKDAAGLE